MGLGNQRWNQAGGPKGKSLCVAVDYWMVRSLPSQVGRLGFLPKCAGPYQAFARVWKLDDEPAAQRRWWSVLPGPTVRQAREDGRSTVRPVLQSN